MANNAENVSIWWRHHAEVLSKFIHGTHLRKLHEDEYFLFKHLHYSIKLFIWWSTGSVFDLGRLIFTFRYVIVQSKTFHIVLKKKSIFVNEDIDSDRADLCKPLGIIVLISLSVGLFVVSRWQLGENEVQN